jgi:hypothetical protein
VRVLKRKARLPKVAHRLVREKTASLVSRIPHFVCSFINNCFSLVALSSSGWGAGLFEEKSNVFKIHYYLAS